MTNETNMSTESIADGRPSTNENAACFSEVTSGVYRRVDVKSVWSALQYAVGNQLAAENPTIMMMFIRIAEVYPQVQEHLIAIESQANESQANESQANESQANESQANESQANGAERLALQLILNPPAGLRNAEYLPEEIASPGEMDLCWGEFLVTGSTEPIEKVVAVLDRDDQTRPMINQLLRGDDGPTLQVAEAELGELASIGVALGQNDGRWEVVSPGDLDIMFWFGVKDQKPTCLQIFKQMTEEHQLHVANKGAAMWSLKANASQHGTIRLFCEVQSKIEGGRGRLLINPTDS